MRVLSTAEVRQFDRIAIEQFGIHSLVLMENAARNACDQLELFLSEALGTNNKRSAVILCGPGNNGGDGLVMARHLHLRQWQIKVILLADKEKLSQDAGVNLRILERTKVPIAIASDDSLKPECELCGFDCIVDALLGTGAKPPLRDPMAAWVQASNIQTSIRMAVDIPSGLSGDVPTHESFSAIKEAEDSVFNADLTVSFVAAKPNMVSVTGKAVCGRIKIVDIGAPPEVFDFLSQTTQHGE